MPARGGALLDDRMRAEVKSRWTYAWVGVFLTEQSQKHKPLYFEVALATKYPTNTYVIRIISVVVSFEIVIPSIDIAV